MDTSRFPTKTVALKIIYTHNDQQQSCMARIENYNAPVCKMGGREFGSVDLTRCLEGICSASPDVLSSESPDYAVYSKDVVEQDCPYVGHGKLSTLRVDSNQVNIVGPVTTTQLPFQRSTKSLDVHLKLVAIPGTSNYQNYHQLPSHHKKRTRDNEFAVPPVDRLKRSRSTKFNNYIASSPIAFGHFSTDDDQQSINDMEINLTPCSADDEDDDESDFNKVQARRHKQQQQQQQQHSEDLDRDDGDERENEHEHEQDEDQEQEQLHNRTLVPTSSPDLGMGEPATEPITAATTTTTPTVVLQSEPDNHTARRTLSHSQLPKGRLATTASKLSTTTTATPLQRTKSTNESNNTTNNDDAKKCATTNAARGGASTRGRKPGTTTKKSNRQLPSFLSAKEYPSYTICCKNCGTSETSVWRKILIEHGDEDKMGLQTLCNSCGLYYAKNKILRPANLWRNEVKKRSKGKRANAASKANTSAAASSTAANSSPAAAKQQPEVSVIHSDKPTKRELPQSSPQQSPERSSMLGYDFTASSSPPTSEAYQTASSPPQSKQVIVVPKKSPAANKVSGSKRPGGDADKENAPPPSSSDHSHEQGSNGAEEDEGIHPNYRKVEAMFIATPKQRTPAKQISDNALNYSPASNFLARIASASKTNKHDNNHMIIDNDPLGNILGSPTAHGKRVASSGANNYNMMELMELSSDATTMVDHQYFSMYEDN